MKSAMRKYLWLTAVWVLLATQNTACNKSANIIATADAATGQAMETRVPFRSTLAWMYCPPFSNRGEGGVYLWEHPGNGPIDEDSDFSSNRGRMIGTLRECTLVQILERRWSIYDKAFYYLVEGDNKKGWVIGDNLVFEEPPSLQPTPSNGQK